MARSSKPSAKKSPTKSKSRRRSPFRRWAWRVAWCAAVGLGAYAAWCAATWPDVAALARANPKTTAFIERWKQGEREERRPGRPAWTWVAYSSVSPHLKRAILVGEDINFFSHHGFEVDEMKKALAEAMEDRELPRGASTITQQTAKNLWLSPSYDPLRKIREAILTWQLERALDKRRILEIYLNVAEFGPGVYGAEAAARVYFRKSAADLSEAEAARLAAGLPDPADWNAGRANRRADRRAAILLARMERAQFLWKEI